LGGVLIPHEAGLEGHSDADVLIHAVCDALLGAAGLGDIGQLFPDKDPKWKDADSRQFLVETRERLDTAGWRVGNLDCAILAERPKLAPHYQAMRRSLAELLNCDESLVSVKAKTNEGLGEIGHGQAIAVHCVSLLRSTL
jgi:2-C-methyl-D-erythritol 2,4-cyclodiphosphate synthase